jgi:hypothetical protein
VFKDDVNHQTGHNGDTVIQFHRRCHGALPVIATLELAQNRLFFATLLQLGSLGIVQSSGLAIRTAHAQDA